MTFNYSGVLVYSLDFWKRVEDDRNSGMTVTATCKKYHILPATLRRARIKGFLNDERKVTAKEAQAKREELKKISPEDLLVLYNNNGESVKYILETFNMTASPTNTKFVKNLIKNSGGVLHSKQRQTSSPYSNEEFIVACAETTCFTKLAQKLNVTSRASSNKKFKELIRNLNIDISHWGAVHNRRKYTYEEIFCKNSEVPRSNLRKYILTHETVDLSKCSKCNLDEWQDEPLLIEIDHINGDNRDNRLKNLRGLCPNCHSLTPTYCRKRR